MGEKTRKTLAGAGCCATPDRKAKQLGAKLDDENAALAAMKGLGGMQRVK